MKNQDRKGKRTNKMAKMSEADIKGLQAQNPEYNTTYEQASRLAAELGAVGYGPTGIYGQALGVISQGFPVVQVDAIPIDELLKAGLPVDVPIALRYIFPHDQNQLHQVGLLMRPYSAGTDPVDSVIRVIHQLQSESGKSSAEINADILNAVLNNPITREALNTIIKEA